MARLTGMAGVLGLVLGGGGGAVAQDDLLFFQTPSGNIHCMIDSGDFAGVRCDILQFRASFRQRPADCDLEWGDSFWIGPADGRGDLVCHGDTVATPDAAVLGYGATIGKSGIACRSEKSGLTCANTSGHGFFLSKASQQIF